VAVDHDEHNSGEVAFMAVAADQPNATSTLGSPAQQQGVGARGSYGGAIGRSWLATVPRRAGASTAEQRRSCCGALGERRNEEEAERVRVSASGRRADGLMSRPAAPGHPRRVAAHSGDRRRAAYTRPSSSDRMITVAAFQ